MIISEIVTRRSIRKFQPEEAPREKIEQMIAAARLAPSGTNKQPWKFIVYRGEAKKKFVEKMAEGLAREEGGAFPHTKKPKNSYHLFLGF